MKLVKGLLKSLKYIGIILIVLYVFLVVKFFISPMQTRVKTEPVIKRIKEAFGEALLVIVIAPMMFIVGIYKQNQR